MPLGTIINSGAVIVGSFIGFLAGKELPERIRSIVFQAIGIATLIIGFKMSIETQNILILIFSLLAGGIVGEILSLERGLGNLTNKFKIKSGPEAENFTEGFLTAFLIFCMGSMTIVGSLDEGLRGDHSVLFTKSILDGFTSIALASTYGIGVMFSVIPLFLYQGSITLLAVYTKDFFTPVIVSQLTAVGGTMIIGIGINLLRLAKIRVINLLPSLFFAVGFTLLEGLLTRVF